VACIKGVMKAAQSLGIHRMILETVIMTTVNAMQATDFRLSSMGGLLHELKEMLAKEFSEPKVSFSPRSCNTVAHELARVDSFCQEDVVFVPGTLLTTSSQD